MSAPLPAVPGTFQEAIAWAKALGAVLPAEFYDALQAEARGKAFTVSGLAGLSQIQQTLDSLNTAIEVGESFENWQARFGAQLGIPHAETVFRNFMQSAYNAGRWRQFERNKGALPYLQFVAIDDGRTTEVCRKLNGTIKPVGDPFWRGRHNPPCHHNCRSTLRALSPAQARRMGLDRPTPDISAPAGWGHKPIGEDMAAGLVAAIAQKSKDMPPSWRSAIAAFFASGWSAIATWIGRAFG